VICSEWESCSLREGPLSPRVGRGISFRQLPSNATALCSSSLHSMLTHGPGNWESQNVFNTFPSPDSSVKLSLIITSVVITSPIHGRQNRQSENISHLEYALKTVQSGAYVETHIHRV
jgi:hypothetical protein